MVPLKLIFTITSVYKTYSFKDLLIYWMEGWTKTTFWKWTSRRKIFGDKEYIERKYEISVDLSIYWSMEDLGNIVHLLVNFPNAHNARSWARQKPRARISSWVSYTAAEPHTKLLSGSPRVHHHVLVFHFGMQESQIIAYCAVLPSLPLRFQSV